MVSHIVSRAEKPGGILIFLPGVQEIRQCIESLRNTKQAKVLPLHANLSNDEQRLVFEPTPSWKIVAATNVAEVSQVTTCVRWQYFMEHSPDIHHYRRYYLCNRLWKSQRDPIRCGDWIDKADGAMGHQGGGEATKRSSWKNATWSLLQALHEKAGSEDGCVCNTWDSESSTREYSIDSQSNEPWCKGTLQNYKFQGRPSHFFLVISYSGPWSTKDGRNGHCVVCPWGVGGDKRYGRSYTSGPALSKLPLHYLTALLNWTPSRPHCRST